MNVFETNDNVLGSAEIAIGPIAVMAERENDIDFTVPYYDLVGITILMKKTDVQYSLFKFMQVRDAILTLLICLISSVRNSTKLFPSLQSHQNRFQSTHLGERSRSSTISWGYPLPRPRRDAT